MFKKNLLKSIVFLGLFAFPCFANGQEVSSEKSLESKAITELFVEEENNDSLLFTYKQKPVVKKITYLRGYEDKYEKLSLFFKVNLHSLPSWMDLEYASQKPIPLLPITQFPATARDGSVAFQVPLEDYVFLEEKD